MPRGAIVARTWQLIRLLESPTGRTLTELEHSLGCSRRTVIRDLQGLQDAGLPVCDERDGREKRWKFIDGFTRKIPPPFTLSELMALYFARAVARPLDGTPIYDPLTAAFNKIETLLPQETKKILASIDGRFVSRSGPFKRYERHKSLIEIVTRAQSEHRCLDIEYRSYGRQETTRRRVAPYQLCYFSAGLYVIGFDDRREDVRIFAIERIQKAALSDETYTVPDSFDFDTYMQSSLGIFRGPEIEVQVVFRPDAAQAITERQWHPSQKFTSRSDGGVLITLRVADTLELRRWILSFGADAEVLAPTSLREEIRDELVELLNQLERTSTPVNQPFLPLEGLENPA